MTKRPEYKVVALKYSFCCWLRFTVNGDQVHVHGPIGAASYIDKKMTREEARKIYREYRADGYAEVADREVPSNWSFWN